MLVNIHKLRTALLLLIIGVMNSPISAEQWTLQQCIDTAQIYNKNLKMSKNNIYIGEQRHKESVAGLIPKVNLNADYKYYTNLFKKIKKCKPEVLMQKRISVSNARKVYLFGEMILAKNLNFVR